MGANAERVVQYTLKVVVDQGAKEAASGLGAALERHQKMMTEISKAEAMRRKNVEVDAGQKILQAMQRHQDMMTKTLEEQARRRRSYEDQSLQHSKRTADSLFVIASDVQKRITEQQKAEEARRANASNDLFKKLEARQKKYAEHAARYNKQAADGFLAAGEGALTAGRGFALLGLMSEENTEKMMKYLLVTQGVYDALRGGIQTYRSLRDGVEAYRKTVDALAKSEAALAVIRGLGGGGGRGGKGGRSNLGVPLPTIGGGLLGGAGMFGAGMYGGGSMPAGAGWGAGGLNAYMGGGAAAGGAGVLGLGLAAGGAVIGGGLGAATFFNVGGFRDWQASGGRMDENHQWQSSYYGFNTGPNSTLGYGIGSLGVPFEAMGWTSGGLSQTAIAQRQAAQETAESERMQAMQNERIRRQMMEAERLKQQYAEESRRRQSSIDRQSTLDQFRPVTADIARGRADTAMAEAQRRIDEVNRMRAGMIPGQRQQFTSTQAGIADDRALHSIQESIRLRKEALDIAQQTKREEERAADIALRNLNQQIEKQKQLKKNTEDRLKSAQERFGQMSIGEQQQAIRIKQKADAQGYAALTREERAVLRGIGTAGAEDIASKGDLLSAQRAGFDRYFGSTERSNLQDIAQERARLELDVKAQQQIIVDLQVDEEAVVRTVVDQVTRLWDAQQQILEDRIKREIADTLANRNRNGANQYLPGA